MRFLRFSTPRKFHSNEETFPPNASLSTLARASWLMLGSARNITNVGFFSSTSAICLSSSPDRLGLILLLRQVEQGCGVGKHGGGVVGGLHK